MTDTTISEEHIAGADMEINMETITRTDTEPSAGPPSTVGSPILKQLPLDLIVSVRNPRHATNSVNGAQADHANRADRADRGLGGSHSVNVEEEPSFLQNIAPADTHLDLEGLARSLGSEADPRLAEPPVVEEMPDGRYRLCAGERRVEAARLAKWARILCLVYPPLDPVRAHTLGLVENIHRLPMHPLEEISALCTSRLLANADARGMGGAARRLLEDAWGRRASNYAIIQGLEEILMTSGWTAARPDVTWKAHLDDLGISMAPWERKRKLRMLNIEPRLQERLRELEITEAALRSLGTLDPGDQERVVEALVANPSLARKVRRIARARRDGFYTSIEDALSEVQGWTLSSPVPAPAPISHGQTLEAVTAPISGAAEISLERGQYGHGSQHAPLKAAAGSSRDQIDRIEDRLPPEIQEAVLQLLECADRLSSVMTTLRAYRGGIALPEPWGTWSGDAIQYIGHQLPPQDHSLL